MDQDAWSDDARKVLNFLLTFWAENRRPPDLYDVHAATGHDFKDVRRIYRDLQQGFALVFTDNRLNLNLQKVTPFSATPTSLYFEADGRFHSFLGCPGEALSVTALPMFFESALTIRSYCVCCFTPVTLEIKNMELLSATPREPLISVLGSPYEWEHGVPSDSVCDALHYVLDAEHARRYEDQVMRRGLTMTIGQMATLTESTAQGRMWDPNWPPTRFDGPLTVDRHAAVGVDVSAWRRIERGGS